MPLIDLHHFNVKTQDLEATDRFYVELLGMTFADRPQFDFPGRWYNVGTTQVHVMAGKAGRDADGAAPYGGAAVDHIAFYGREFDAMKRRLEEHGLEWRQFSIPPAKLWQLFVHDPNGVLIEINFDVTQEPAGAKGPDGGKQYEPGHFLPTMSKRRKQP